MEIKINIYIQDIFYGTYKLQSINSEYRWVYYYADTDKNILTLQATSPNWYYKFSPEHLKGEGVAIPYGD